ncbi:hypothetical protein [Pseudomonas gingeri]
MDEAEGESVFLKVILADHSCLKILFPHMHSYALKGLAVQMGKEEVFSPTAIEQYSVDVLGKISELDGALVSLRLAYRFIVELGAADEPSPDIYRYHYENFVLRTMGVVDRSYRLVGASLLLDAKRYEAVGGNRYVQGEISKKFSEVRAAVCVVERVVRKYKAPRNELIHSSAYTTRELGVFESIKNFDIDVGGVDVEGLKRGYSLKGAREVYTTIVKLTEALICLLDALSTIYKSLQKANTRKPIS